MHSAIRVPVALQVGKLTLLAGLTLSSPILRAGAQTDGTAGRSQTFSGNFTVPQSLGTLSGGNLFHSFLSFSINAGESATFTTSTPVQNLVARVTGGGASTLAGPLRLTAAGGAKPNLFLVNPAGITSAAGSSVDVPGTFHLSTANYLKFADGSVYQTDTTQGGSTFSAAAPAAFGFVGAKAGALVVQSGAGLTFTAGQSVALTAGDITIASNILSVGGGVRIAAVGQAAVEVGLTGPMPALAGRLAVANGALVGSYNVGTSNAGDVTVAAGDVVVGSTANAAGAGILSVAAGAGHGANIQVSASQTLTLQNGGQVSSSTQQAGHGGDLAVNVGGNLRITNSSGIGTVASAAGSAGSVKVAALGTLLLDGGGTSTGAFILTNAVGAGGSGTVSVSAGGSLSLVNGGQIGSSFAGLGTAGSVSVVADSISMDNQGGLGRTGIASASSGTGTAASVDVRATGALSVVNGSSIASSTFGAGQSGAVTVRAGSIALDGSGGVNGIVSETAGSGNAGSVTVTADADIRIANSARISSSSFQSGNAGAVNVSSAGLTIVDANPGANASGILSIAKQAGNAGTVDVAVSGALSITDGVISTSTESSGRGGAITVKAGSLLISNTGTNAGAGIASNASGTGDAGNVSVTSVQALKVLNGATISSSTFAQGAAGSVSVTAGSLEMDGQGSAHDTSIVSETYGSGSGGSVQVRVDALMSIFDQATISSSAFASGKGGQVLVRAGSIDLDNLGGSRRSGIGSVAFSGTGDAGGVDVGVVGALSLSNGSEISANTSTAGAAGSVRVSAQTISVASGASINSGATPGSSGRTGDVSVSADQGLTLTDSRISIQNDATVTRPTAVPASTLSVTAPRIGLANSEITASATGNIAAGQIVIEASELLTARTGSAINTSAVSGQGGSVTLYGGGALLLDHSRLTTSVTGTTNGNGGPITIDSPLIVLNSGFIQANTAVANARGGDVNINLSSPPGVLLVSGEQLITGGQPVRYLRTALNGPNVIQAARPDGVNGELHIASPEIDISASLAALLTPRLDFGALGSDMCRIGDDSSLTPVGRGGLRPSYSERVRPSR